MKYSFVCRLIPQRFIDGQWRVIESRELTNPANESDWIRLFPLRISLLSYKNAKAGVAENAVQFREIMEKMGHTEMLERRIGKRQDEIAKGVVLRPHLLSRDVAENYGRTAK